MERLLLVFALLPSFAVFAEGGTVPPPCLSPVATVLVRAEEVPKNAGTGNSNGVTPLSLELFVRRKLEETGCFTVTDSAPADFTFYYQSDVEGLVIREQLGSHSNVASTVVGGVALVASYFLPLPVTAGAMGVGALAEANANDRARTEIPPVKLWAAVAISVEMAGRHVVGGNGRDEQIYVKLPVNLCEGQAPMDGAWGFSPNECVQGINRATLQVLPHIFEEMRKVAPRSIVSAP
ncbi:MAG: hypothetical protein AAB545_03005 [Patescibacteria group bacterium]